MLYHTWPYLQAATQGAAPGLTITFNALVWLTYSFIYLLPALALVVLIRAIAPQRHMAQGILAVLTTSSSLLFILADRTIYDLYNFHFNGFVANLLFTPGGVRSLGGGNDTYIGIGVITVRTVLLQIGSLWLATRWDIPRRVLQGGFGSRLLAPLIAVLLVAQALLYGIGDVRQDGSILESAKAFPFFQRVRFRSLAEKLGFDVAKAAHINAAASAGKLRYPVQSFEYRPVARPPNIIMLVSESMRWDQLTADIMPNTYRFAQRAQHFTQHYSSGNGTREGLFGMFYGLYGSYWQSFLYARRAPLLMDRIQALDYQLDLRTSARFTYPEFDKTLFANIPPNLLHEGDESLNSAQNDERHTTALLDFLDRRDTARPFMTFLFFDATHARYSFPESAVIKRPYLENLNYSEVSKASLAPRIDELLNRYANASHWIDTQMGRVFDYLEKNGLLENTIVIVTGDHGEEFMERGFWGHNSSFVEWQTHTPMVVSIPGKAHEQIDRLTSHVDISTTLLQELGAPADASGYSLGRNLFDDSPRPFIVISDWHSIAVRTADMNYRIPYLNHGTEQWVPLNHADEPYPPADAAHVLEKNRAEILSAIKNSSTFYAPK